MIIKITNKITFQDTVGSPSLSSTNQGVIEWTYDGSSNSNQGFDISNVNKYTWEISDGGKFDLNIQQDLLMGVSEIKSLHVFCYESNANKPYKLPLRFDVVLDDMDLLLAKTCDFSLGNLKELNSDIRICNIEIPNGSKATLIIIVATK